MKATKLDFKNGKLTVPAKNSRILKFLINNPMAQKKKPTVPAILKPKRLHKKKEVAPTVKDWNEISVPKGTVVHFNTDMDELILHRNKLKAELQFANLMIADKKAFYKKECEKS